jgi:hypothetical protein
MGQLYEYDDLEQERFDEDSPQPLHPTEGYLEEENDHDDEWNEEEEEILQAMQAELTRIHEEESDEIKDGEGQKDETVKEEPIELKKVMISAAPTKTKNGSTVEITIKEVYFMWKES